MDFIPKKLLLFWILFRKVGIFKQKIDRMIQRILTEQFEKNLKKNKIILVLGARQVGKTTLLKTISKQFKTLWLNGDEYDVQQQFNQPTSTKLRALIGNHDLLIIDEAQRIDQIGLCLKLLIDNYPEIKIIASGSSAFELRNKTNEPLTGRKFEYQLFPLSHTEMVQHHGIITEKRLLQTRLVYGYYPEIVNNPGDEKELLKQLADSYLFKDILMLDNIKKPEKLVKLLQALAFQIGSEVSYNELGNLVGLDSKTVENYIQILEKTFIIFKLSSFNRNLRNELKNSKKIYFVDNGIRNALIGNYQAAETRQDIGALFENFIISERIKQNHYSKRYTSSYFWRTKEQQEIDLIEDFNGELYAFEFKWNAKKKVRLTKTFTNAYPSAQTHVITPENYTDFLNNTLEME